MVSRETEEGREYIIERGNHYVSNESPPKYVGNV